MSQSPPPRLLRNAIFELSGDQVGSLSAVQVGKLVPTYQGVDSIPDPYGCSFLRDGRLVTSDIGMLRSGRRRGSMRAWWSALRASW